MKQILGIDIGGTFIKGAILSEEGGISKKFSYATPNSRKKFLLLLKELTDLYKEDIRGVAISCPGKVDTETGTIYFGGNVSYLNELPLKAILESESQLPVSVINDGRAVVLAEFWQGNLQNKMNSCAIALGTAIGGGIILNGLLYEGAHFQAGELSFMPYGGYNQKGANIGEELSAVKFIKQACQKLNIEDYDGKTFFEEVEKNRPEATELLTTYCQKLAYYILSIQAILDLEKVVIGGGISQQPQLISELGRQLLVISTKIPGYSTTLKLPQIQACKFYNDANLIGALYNFIQTNS